MPARAFFIFISLMIDLKKITRKLIVQIEDADGNLALAITFFWLPAALTKRTLPQFVALNDEPLAQVQREALETLIAKQKTAQTLSEGQPSINASVVTREALEAEIEARRSQDVEVQAAPGLLAARKLLLLLDPEKPTDLTDGGVIVPADAEAFAEAIPLELIQAVTASILQAMHEPFFIIATGAATSSTSKPPEQTM